jgi:hypothetical protein
MQQERDKRRRGTREKRSAQIKIAWSWLTDRIRIIYEAYGADRRAKSAGALQGL